jgi:D-alanyl-D-alanine carboxypeptidase
VRFSLMNLLKSFVTDSKFWGDYEGNWLRLKSHYLDGPAFGGLIGTARGFGRFLQDQLRPASVLLRPASKRLLETPQSDSRGRPIPMTLGWHVGKTDAQRVDENGGEVYFFKEGGGAGFHGEMRVYPAKGIASVVLANEAGFDATRFLDRADRATLAARAPREAAR